MKTQQELGNIAIRCSLVILSIVGPVAYAGTPVEMTAPGVWNSGAYAYDGTGNIKAIGSNVYRYDSAGRLITATANGAAFTQTYGYDAFGNRQSTVTTPGAGCIGGIECQENVTIDPATNHIVSTANAPAYDAAGNLIALDGTTYTYDGVSVLRTQSNTGDQFVYTVDDERLASIASSGSWRWTVRDLQGRALSDFTSANSAATVGTASFQWTKDYIYRGGPLLASRQNTGETLHFHLDHLGTPRLITNAAGVSIGVHTYFPFGSELALTPAETPVERMKFTGHERDYHGSVQDLDYMHARYYNASVGRFLCVDPGPADIAVPQSWNRYTYALNSPLKYVDPTGEVVNLAGLTAEERNDLLLSLNNVTGNEYGTNNNGELTVINYGQNGSATATQFLDGAIAATNTYMVNAVNNSSAVNSMNSYQATGAINIDFADFKNTNNSGLSSESFGLGSNLIHELVHVHNMWNDPPAAGTPGVPAAQDAKHTTGPVVDFVNQIHRERGLPQRGPSYAPQNTDRTIGGRVRVPFIDPRTGRMVYVWPKLRP